MERHTFCRECNTKLEFSEKYDRYIESDTKVEHTLERCDKISQGVLKI